LSLERDIEAIEQRVLEMGDCKLIIVDPISAYLGSVDTHRNSDVRAVLAPLAKLAQRLGVAIVAVSHLNKGASASAAYRVTGSIAFTAAVRASLLLAKDKDVPERRLVLPGKNNLGPDNLGGLAYRVATHRTVRRTGV
jgi:putative DNA primase/helicase